MRNEAITTTKMKGSVSKVGNDNEKIDGRSLAAEVNLWQQLLATWVAKWQGLAWVRPQGG